MKTIDEIKKEVAKECGEDHFEVLLEAEISIEDFETARMLLRTVADRYVNQFIEHDELADAGYIDIEYSIRSSEKVYFGLSDKDDRNILTSHYVQKYNYLYQVVYHECAFMLKTIARKHTFEDVWIKSDIDPTKRVFYKIQDVDLLTIIDNPSFKKTAIL